MKRPEIEVLILREHHLDGASAVDVAALIGLERGEATSTSR